MGCTIGVSDMDAALKLYLTSSVDQVLHDATGIQVTGKAFPTARNRSAESV